MLNHCLPTEQALHLGAPVGRNDIARWPNDDLREVMSGKSCRQSSWHEFQAGAAAGLELEILR
jgi:hypothetical protein